MGFKFSPGCTCCNCCNDFALNHLEFDVDLGPGLQNGLCTDCDKFSGNITVQINQYFKTAKNCLYTYPYSTTPPALTDIELLGGPCDSTGTTAQGIQAIFGCPLTSNGHNELIGYFQLAQGLFEIFVLNPNQSPFSNPIYQNKKCEIVAFLIINQVTSGFGVEGLYYTEQVWRKEIDIEDWNKIIGMPIELPKDSSKSNQSTADWQPTICLYNDGNRIVQSQPPCTGGYSWPDPLIITPQLV